MSNNFDEPDTDTAFAPGDRVEDSEDDGGVGIVLSYRRTGDGDLVPAWAAPIAALDGETVAEVNEDYPDDEPVVTIAFEKHLDQHIGERWRAWAEEADDDGTYDFHGRVSSYAAEWGIPLKSYDYPEARLERVIDGQEGGDDE